MSACPACGGLIGRDCFNPQECMEITRDQAARYREHCQQELTPVSHAMDERNDDAGDYIHTLRDQWANSTDGSSWTGFLERKLRDTRQGVNYWSYCTDSGMRRECPEKVDELCDFLMSLGIAPYSMRVRR